MDTTQQQVSGAPSAAQAAAPAQPAQIPPPPQPAAQPIQSSQDLVPRAYLDAATRESIKRKDKVRAAKAALGEAQASVAALTTDRDALKAQVEANNSRIQALSDRMAEAALISSLRSEGLTEDAAKMLLPALRAHVSVDPETFAVTVEESKIKAAAQIIKPQPPANPRAGLHNALTSARTPPVQDRPMSARERLRAEAEALAAKLGGR
jgi:hypothetical protein